MFVWYLILVYFLKRYCRLVARFVCWRVSLPHILLKERNFFKYLYAWILYIFGGRMFLFLFSFLLAPTVRWYPLVQLWFCCRKIIYFFILSTSLYTSAYNIFLYIAFSKKKTHTQSKVTQKNVRRIKENQKKRKNLYWNS